MNENVAYWIDMAEYDLETARAMFATKRYLYVGFMCHLVIEKALKAAIFGVGDSAPPKIHNLIRLTELAGFSALLSPEQRDFIEALNPLNIEARYESYKTAIAAGLSDESCAELIKGTEVLFAWIKQRL